jgi:hypothetical protein
MSDKHPQGRIMRPADREQAPDAVYVEFSLWSDGTVEIEDFQQGGDAPKPHWVRYVRDVTPATAPATPSPDPA